MIQRQQRQDRPFRPYQRALLALAIALLLMAAGMFGTIFVLEHRLENPSKPVPRHFSYLQSSTRKVDLVKAAADRDKIPVLREKWQHWAEAHQELLRSLLHAKPEDQATLMRVEAQLPPDPFAIGFTPDDLNRGSRFQFTWNQGHYVVNTTKPWVLEMEAREKRYQEARLQKDFRSLRDIAISDSESTPRLYYVLYASGRITEVSFNGSGSIDQDSTWDRREVMPPYEFLR